MTRRIPLDVPLLIGHRGAPGYRPEHTASSYRLAFAMGVDAVSVRQALADADRMVTSLDVPDARRVAWSGYLPEEIAISSERDALLHRAIDALPDRKRAVVRAIYFDDRTVKDIAEELGVSHAAVSQQRSEAMRMLRDALARHDADLPQTAQLSSRSSAAALDAYFERVAATGKRITRALSAEARVA